MGDVLETKNIFDDLKTNILKLVLMTLVIATSILESVRIIFDLYRMPQPFFTLEFFLSDSPLLTLIHFSLFYMSLIIIVSLVKKEHTKYSTPKLRTKIETLTKILIGSITLKIALLILFIILVFIENCLEVGAFIGSVSLELINDFITNFSIGACIVILSNSLKENKVLVKWRKPLFAFGLTFLGLHLFLLIETMVYGIMGSEKLIYSVISTILGDTVLGYPFNPYYHPFEYIFSIMLLSSYALIGLSIGFDGWYNYYYGKLLYGIRLFHFKQRTRDE